MENRKIFSNERRRKRERYFNNFSGKFQGNFEGKFNGNFDGKFNGMLDQKFNKNFNGKGGGDMEKGSDAQVMAREKGRVGG